MLFLEETFCVFGLHLASSVCGSIGLCGEATENKASTDTLHSLKSLDLVV